jgi:hypothetical protein
VLSFHDFTGTPPDLASRVRDMARAPHEVLKVATHVESLADCVRLRAALAPVERRIVIGMGRGGVITRVCPWIFGSAWTYAGGAAPGQLALESLVRDFRIRETSAASRVFGTTGEWEAALALAVAHNRAFRARDVDAVSVPLVPERDLDEAARVLGIEAIAAAAPADAAAIDPRAARDVDRWTGK